MRASIPIWIAVGIAGLATLVLGVISMTGGESPTHQAIRANTKSCEHLMNIVKKQQSKLEVLETFVKVSYQKSESDEVLLKLSEELMKLQKRVFEEEQARKKPEGGWEFRPTD